MLSVVYVKCHKIGLYAEYSYAECHKIAPYAQCLYAECLFAECRGAFLVTWYFNITESKTPMVA
jgi:hypothetical protein